MWGFICISLQEAERFWTFSFLLVLFVRQRDRLSLYLIYTCGSDNGQPHTQPEVPLAGDRDNPIHVARSAETTKKKTGLPRFSLPVYVIRSPNSDGLL
jgi:hypothetical protein